MSQYDADALMAYFKKHQISRRTAVVGGAVVVVAGASGAYLALQPGGQAEQTTPTPTTPSTPTAPSRPSTPSTPRAPSRPRAPAPTPAPSPPTQEKRKIVIAIQENMPTLFPLNYPPGGAGPHRTMANVMEMLIYQNRDWRVNPGGKTIELGMLADGPAGVAPVVPGDWSNIRVKLRKNVRFHSGAKLTSESLVGPNSFQHVYADSNWFFYFPVPGRGPPPMTGEIVDETTAILSWERSNINNMNTLTHSGRPFIWNPAWIEEHGIEGRGKNLGGADQDGTGPFKMKEWIPGERIVMERNRDYWADNLPEKEKHELWGKAGAKGNLDEITFVQIREEAAAVVAIQSGDVDVLVETPLHQVSQLERNPKVNTFDSQEGQIFAVYINTAPGKEGDPKANPVKALQNAKVRQAMVLGMDVRGLRAIFDDRHPIARSLFLPWMLGFNDNIKAWKPQDVGKAKKLLAEAGYKDGFDMVLGPDARPDNALLGTAMGPMLQDIGINVETKVIPTPDWNAITRNAKQTEIHMYPFSIGFRGESLDLFDFFFRPAYRRNRASMDLPQLYGTWQPGVRGRPDFGPLGQVAREADPAKRAVLYQSIAQTVVDEALLYVPLYVARTASYSQKILNWADTRQGPYWRGNGNFNPYRTRVA